MPWLIWRKDKTAASRLWSINPYSRKWNPMGRELRLDYSSFWPPRSLGVFCFFCHLEKWELGGGGNSWYTEMASTVTRGLGHSCRNCAYPEAVSEVAITFTKSKPPPSTSWYFPCNGCITLLFGRAQVTFSWIWSSWLQYQTHSNSN